jgi:hypothetical protein
MKPDAVSRPEADGRAANAGHVADDPDLQEEVAE